MTKSFPNRPLSPFAASRGAARLFLGAAVALGLAGCYQPTGDQTEARLKEMAYSLDNLVEEVAGRLKEARRRGTEKAPAKPPGTGVRGGDADRGDGPGGNPFSIEAIALDVADKLRGLQYAHSDDKVLKDLGESLREQKVPDDLVDPFLARLKAVELPPEKKS